MWLTSSPCDKDSGERFRAQGPSCLLITHKCAKTPFDVHADVSSMARGLTFGPSLHLQCYFVYASSEGSGDCAFAQAGLSLHCLAIQQVPKSVKNVKAQ